MKLLLTSAGITNKSLARALKSIVKGEIRIAFIPTAANPKDGDKWWLIKNYDQCEKLGTVDIVDISAMGRKAWLARLRKANVIFMGGGNTVYLMKWIVKSGLKKELPKLLKNRVYVGISAGSLVMGKSLSSSEAYVFSNKHKNAPLGLGYVDFNLRSHYNSPDHPEYSDKHFRKVAPKIGHSMYALDDNSGILCVNGRVKVISEGKWKKY